MDKPKISVVIPTFNRSDVLSRAINSVISQTFQDHEVIIVDDGSTDNTAQVVKEIQKKDERIIYYYQDNQGPSAARNFGIKKSRGNYIAFLDSDDVWLREKLQQQIQIFKSSTKKNLGFVGSNKEVVLLDSDQNIIRRYDLYKKRFKPSKDHFTIKDFLSLTVPVSPTSALILKRALLDVGIFDLKFPPHEDYELWIRLSTKYDFDTTWKILARYYKWSGGISNQTSSLKKAKLKKFLLDKHIELYNKYPESKAVLLRKIGTDYILAENHPKAVGFFVESIKLNPFRARSYLNLLVSLLGSKIYKLIFKYHKYHAEK